MLQQTEARGIEKASMVERGKLIKPRACNDHHLNITALRKSVDREWMAKRRDYVIKS